MITNIGWVHPDRYRRKYNLIFKFKMKIRGLQNIISEIQFSQSESDAVEVKTGRTETQSFKVQLSKSIIDEIDKVLGKHYRLNETEIDFIINYDIKYRMGY